MIVITSENTGVTIQAEKAALFTETQKLERKA